MSETASPTILSSILQWLRAGYPDNIPPKDYFPLLALLKKSLSEDQIRAIVDLLTRDETIPIDNDAIEAAIVRIADETPSNEEINLVAARLAAAGWPLADINSSNH